MTQFVLGDHLAGLSFEPPRGEPGYARLLTSHRRPYQTLDGHLCVLIYNDKHWKSFFTAIGDPQRFTQDERFSTHSQRATHIDAVYSQVADIMRGRSTAEWQTLLDGADIPNMPMNSPQDLLDDPHLRASGFIRDIEHPTEGRLRTPGNPTRWSHTPCTEPGPAPQLGQHTAQILREAGYAENVIQAMLTAGIASQHSNAITEK